MSIWGNAITLGSSGGGGGPSASDAILTVTVPTGSTVTAAKGGVTLTPTMWVQAADATLDCALFVIAPAQFDATTPWTVTATLGNDTASDTVTIDSNEQYDVELSYTYYLYKDGDECSRITGGWQWAAASGAGTYSNNTATGQMVVTITGSSYQTFLHTVNKISVSEWSAVKALIKHTAGQNMYLQISNTADRQASAVTYINAPISTDFELVTLDVTSYTGEYYIGIKTGWSGTTFFVSAVWCE